LGTRPHPTILMRSFKELPMRIVIAIGSAVLDYPWEENEAVLLLGGIENMPGHVAVATKDGKVHWGFDADSFREPTEDEI